VVTNLLRSWVKALVKWVWLSLTF